MGSHDLPGRPCWDGRVICLQAFIGVGTTVNIGAIVAGSLVGLALGNRLPERSRSLVTDALGLVTMVIGALSIRPVTQPVLSSAVPHGGAMIVVLLALLTGSLIGAGLRLEDRITALGEWTRDRLGRSGQHSFVEGFVSATLVFCVGPLAILGSLSDGLGKGSEQLIVKAVLDGFASIAFASALGMGVMASIVPVAVYQGGLTLIGWTLGDVLPPAQVDALTVTGGIILIGMGLRLLDLKQVRVADMVPALVMAPLLVQVAGHL